MLAALLFISCGKEPGPELSRSATLQPIDFTVGAVQESKGTGEINTSSIKTQHFGVFAYRNDLGDSFCSTTSLPESYLENTDVQFDRNEGGVDYWKCSPAAYWPLASCLSFFAYAPYQANVTQEAGAPAPMVLFPSEDYTGGMPRLRFTPAADVSEQVDFCVASPLLDWSAAKGNVSMVFEHALTRVRFYMNIDGAGQAGYQYRVTSLAIRGLVSTNVLTYSASGGKSFVWDEAAGTAMSDGEYTLSASMLTEDPVKFISDLTTETGTDRYTHLNSPSEGHMFLLPQTLGPAVEVDVEVSLYAPDGTGYVFYSVLPVKTFVIPSDTWDAGETVSYMITFELP